MKKKSICIDTRPLNRTHDILAITAKGEKTYDRRIPFPFTVSFSVYRSEHGRKRCGTEARALITRSWPCYRIPGYRLCPFPTTTPLVFVSDKSRCPPVTVNGGAAKREPSVLQFRRNQSSYSPSLGRYGNRRG